MFRQSQVLRSGRPVLASAVALGLGDKIGRSLSMKRTSTKSPALQEPNLAFVLKIRAAKELDAEFGGWPPCLDAQVERRLECGQPQPGPVDSFPVVKRFGFAGSKAPL